MCESAFALWKLLNLNLIKYVSQNWQWNTPVIPTTQESEAGELNV